MVMPSLDFQAFNDIVFSIQGHMDIGDPDVTWVSEDWGPQRRIGVIPAVPCLAFW